MTGAAPAPVPDRGELARRLRLWADVDLHDAPLYRRLALVAAETPEILDLLARARPGQRRPVMLMAAVHFLLLDGVDHPLARFYPSLTSEPEQGDPAPEFVDFCRRHRHRLVEVMTSRRVQTNEVGRSAALHPAMVEAGKILGERVALVEVGASAGLNLAFDRYGCRYEAGEEFLDQPGESDVGITCTLRGPGRPILAPLPRVERRVGIDLHPVDVTDPDARLWLRACVFADHSERMARLEAALDAYASNPCPVVGGDGTDLLEQVTDDLPDGLPVVLWHSWALTYFLRDRRPAFTEAVERVAARRPVVWLSFEGPGTAPFLPSIDGADDSLVTVVGLVDLTGDEPKGRVLALSHPHAAWMTWHP